MTLTKPLRGAFITLAVGAFALMAAPSPALAGDDDLGRCKAGMVCLYKGSLADADLIDRSYGALTKTSLAANTNYYIVNNGQEQVGQDHFYFGYNGTTKCLHFSEGKVLDDGAWVHLRSSSKESVTNQRWGGECS